MLPHCAKVGSCLENNTVHPRARRRHIYGAAFFRKDVHTILDDRHSDFLPTTIQHTLKTFNFLNVTDEQPFIITSVTKIRYHFQFERNERQREHAVNSNTSVLTLKLATPHNLKSLHAKPFNKNSKISRI